MATTYKGPQAGLRVQPRTGENGLLEITGRFVIEDAIDTIHGGGAGATAFVDEDKVEMVKVPVGARIKDVILKVPALDSSTGIVVQVGIGGDLDKFITAATVGRSSTAGLQRMNNPDGVDYVFTAEDTIDFHVETVASGTPVTSGTIILEVVYSLQALPTSVA